MNEWAQLALLAVAGAIALMIVGLARAPSRRSESRPAQSLAPIVPLQSVEPKDAEAEELSVRAELPERDQRMASAIEQFVRGIDPLVAGRQASPGRFNGAGPTGDGFGGDALAERLLGRDEWDRVVHHEGLRFARYRHPTTVVVAELLTRAEDDDDSLDEEASNLEDFAARRLLGPTAETLVRLARSSDRAGRLGRSRFGLLLFETGEAGAQAYVRRVRDACDDWLRAAPLAVMLSIGWASPGPGEQLRDAFRAADMRRTTGRPAGPRSRLAAGPPRVDRRRAVRPA